LCCGGLVLENMSYETKKKYNVHKLDNKKREITKNIRKIKNDKNDNKENND